MSNMNFKFSEMNAILGALNPASVAAGTVTSSYVSLAQAETLAALVMVGAGGGTVTCSLLQAQDTSGTGSKAITGKATTGSTNANVQYTLECRDTDLDANNGFNTVAVQIVVAGATTILGATLFGANPSYVPGSGFNAATVQQQV